MPAGNTVYAASERWLLVSSLELNDRRLVANSWNVLYRFAPCLIFKMGDDETSGVLIGWFFGCCRRSCLELCCVIIFAWEDMLQYQVRRVGWRLIVLKPMWQSGKVTCPCRIVVWITCLCCETSNTPQTPAIIVGHRMGLRRQQQTRWRHQQMVTWHRLAPIVRPKRTWYFQISQMETRLHTQPILCHNQQ